MTVRLTPSPVFVLAMIAVLGHVAFHYAELPQTLAVHFDGRGRPNAFAARDAFTLMTAGLVAFLAALYWAAGRVQTLSPQFVNVPNKDYWLSEERRAASMAFVATWARWLLALAMALIALVIGSVLHANLWRGGEIGTAPLYEVAGFLVVAAGMVVWLLRRFPAPRAQ